MSETLHSQAFRRIQKGVEHISNENSTLSYNNINKLEMDSKAILKNIMTMLGVENKEVALGGNANAGGPFFGKLEDGSPVMSDFFDVGHTLLVIKEDGSKVAAPDADHIIYLPVGLAGGQKRYFITTKDGVITSMNLEDNYGAKKVNVNFAAEEKSNQMETTKLAEDSLEIKDEKKAVEKEEKMQDDASRLDSLEEQVNQLRVDIAQLFEEMKKENMKKEEMGMEIRDEKDEVKKLQEKDQLQGMPNDGGPQKMSAQKKFTGAPVEEKVNLGGLVKSNKVGTTVGSVLARMNNSKF